MNDLAGNGTEGSFTPEQLWAGDSPTVTTARRLKNGVNYPKYAVLQEDAAGNLSTMASDSLSASATLRILTNPAADDTVTVNGHAITFKASGATGQQVNIGADAAATAAALETYLDATSATGVSAARTTDTLTLTALAGGEAGNLISLATSVPAKISLSDGTMSGGVDAGEVKVTAILAQPVNLTAVVTPTMAPVFVEGFFNHEALIWPAYLDTLEKRQQACSGTPIHVRNLY